MPLPPHDLSPTVNIGHSQEMTSVKAVHTHHTSPRDGSTKAVNLLIYACYTGCFY